MNRGSTFDWYRHNKEHVAAHRVEPHEFGEVLANEPLYVETRIDAGSGEERILELGHTNRGRGMFVAWTPRDGLIRPVTAFEANRKTRTAYKRKRYEEKQQ
jgi:uncharacterized DUF497 family protein